MPVGRHRRGGGGGGRVGLALARLGEGQVAGGVVAKVGVLPHLGGSVPHGGGQAR